MSISTLTYTDSLESEGFKHFLIEHGFWPRSELTTHIKIYLFQIGTCLIVSVTSLVVVLNLASAGDLQDKSYQLIVAASIGLVSTSLGVLCCILELKHRRRRCERDSLGDSPHPSHDRIRRASAGSRRNIFRNARLQMSRTKAVSPADQSAVG